MLIDYNETTTYSQTLQVDDIGNFAIRCHGTMIDGKFKMPADYYMMVKTVAGRATIVKFGPVIPDIPTMPSGFEVTVKTTKFNEPSLGNEVSNYINDGRREITEAEEIVEQELYEAYPSLEETFNSL